MHGRNWRIKLLKITNGPGNLKNSTPYATSASHWCGAAAMMYSADLKAKFLESQNMSITWAYLDPAGAWMATHLEPNRIKNNTLPSGM